MFWLEEWKTKQPTQEKQACLYVVLEMTEMCIHLLSMFLNTWKCFKKQNICNLYKAIACYSTELLKVSGVRMIMEEAQ